MNIINLTQHSVTPEQIAEKVINVPNEQDRAYLSRLLTFNSPEDATPAEMERRAQQIAVIANHAGSFQSAMIGGAPYFMPYVAKALFDQGIIAYYSFTQRVSVDKHNEDGSVTKSAVFKHTGWVNAI